VSETSADVVRRAIYGAVVERAAAPSVADVAETTGLSPDQVASAYRSLADAHVIVLRPGTIDLAWAPPFSMIPTAFTTRIGSRAWYAPCAWDAFGIAAALGKDAAISASCAWSGIALDCGVAGGRPFGHGVVHLLVPAAHFWDDIFYT
jgi:hypothetical protein